MAEQAKPIHEIFLPRAHGVGHLVRNYGIEGLQGFSAGEALTVDLIPGSGDVGPTLRFWRHGVIGSKHRQGVIEFGNIQAMDPRNVLFGPETLLKSEQLGATSQTVNNGGYRDININLRDLFGKEDSSEESTEKSAGTSLKVSVESEQDVEGFAKFKESVEAEAHAEVSESSSRSQTSSHEEEGGEDTSVPPGGCIIALESRARADTSQVVTASGAFTHTVRVGQYSHKVAPKHKWGMVQWDSWGQFVDVVKGDAPDNWPWATKFKEHPPNHGDLWALADINSPLRYVVKFEGKIIRKYSVQKCGS